MSRVKSGRRTPHPDPINCTKCLITIVFFVSIFGIVYLSYQMNDPISFGWGVFAGFVWFIAFYLLWKYTPPSHWKKG